MRGWLTPCVPAAAAIGDHIASIDATGDSLHSSGAVEGAQAARSAAEAGVKKSEDDVRAVVAELEAISAKQGAAIKDLLEKAAALQVGRRGWAHSRAGLPMHVDVQSACAVAIMTAL
jgi:hypothetical protein